MASIITIQRACGPGAASRHTACRRAETAPVEVVTEMRNCLFSLAVLAPLLLDPHTGERGQHDGRRARRHTWFE